VRPTADGYVAITKKRNQRFGWLRFPKRGLQFFNNSVASGLALANALEQAEIDQVEPDQHGGGECGI